MSKKPLQGAVQSEIEQPTANEVVNAVETSEADAIDSLDDLDDEDPFAEFEDEDDDVKSKKDIIKELLASKRCKMYRDINIKYIEYKPSNTNDYFVVSIRDTKVIGNVSINNVNVIQKTSSILIGRYSLRAVMFDEAKTSIFANDILTDTKLCTKLFNSGKVDIIAQLVKAGEEYVNPFSSTKEPTIFLEDRIIHHIINISLGKTGEEYYREYLRR